MTSIEDNFYSSYSEIGPLAEPEEAGEADPAASLDLEPPPTPAHVKSLSHASSDSQYQTINAADVSDLWPVGSGGHVGVTFRARWDSPDPALGVTGVVIKATRRVPGGEAPTWLEADFQERVPAHPFVLDVYGVIPDLTTVDDGAKCSADEFYPNGLVLPYLSLGQLHRVIRFQKNPTATCVNRTEFFRYAIQMASGIAHMHRFGVVHRDVAMRNFLAVDGEAHEANAVLADFGLATYVVTEDNLRAQGKPAIARQFAWRWCPPEWFGHPCPWSLASDVWQFGLTLWELWNVMAPGPTATAAATGAPESRTSKADPVPFESAARTPRQLRQLLLRGDREFDLPLELAGCTDERLVALWQSCLAIQPKERPSMDKVLLQLCDMFQPTTASTKQLTGPIRTGLRDRNIAENADYFKGSLPREAFVGVAEFLLGGEFRDWARFRTCSKPIQEAIDTLTNVERDIAGQTVALFRWSPVATAGPATAYYIRLPQRHMISAKAPSAASLSDNHQLARLDSRGLLNCSSSWQWKGKSSSRTFWAKVRFDPATMMVHTGDFTFSFSAAVAERAADSLRQLHVEYGDGRGQDVIVGNMTPFATCLDCAAPESAQAAARIDLRTTPFAIKSDFSKGGHRPGGSTEIGASRQLASVYGGGYCGWSAPKLAVDTAKVDDQPGGYFLELQLASDV